MAAINLACKIRFLGDTFVCGSMTGKCSTDRYSDAIQTKFLGLETLAFGATKIVPLAQSLTLARLSVDDLIVVVRLSTLNSRASLVKELLGISLETKDASHNLQKLFAEIHATIDIMLAVNDHLLRLLQTRISSFSSLAVYCYTIGNSLHLEGCNSSSTCITEAYDRTLHQFQEVLSTLFLRVVQVQGNLDGIEAKLGVVRDLVTMETGIVMSDKSDVTSHILALLKLPSQRTIQLNAQLRSLREITHLHTLTTRYITGTMDGLRELEESMGVLRSMALGATLVDGVPMEAIIAALSKGIDRVRQANGPRSAARDLNSPAMPMTLPQA